MLVAAARAQSFTVSDPTRLANTYYWTPLTIAGSGGSFLTDAAADQQTGQIEDDFVGSGTNPGFLMRYGTVGGQESVAFRLIENRAYANNKGVPTFTGQASIGMDANGDGSIDIVFSVIGKSQGNGINYQVPGTGANVSPNTTTLGSPTLITAFTTTNFNYQLVNPTIYPNYTSVGTDSDAVLSFSLTFAQINAALAAINPSNPITITTTSLVRFIAFTSTQTNAINQDVYGSTGISGAVRFDAPGGGFTEFTDMTGRPVPEPSTIAAVAGLLATGLAVRWRRWRRGKRDLPAAAGARLAA